MYPDHRGDLREMLAKIDNSSLKTESALVNHRRRGTRRDSRNNDRRNKPIKRTNWRIYDEVKLILIVPLLGSRYALV